MTPFRFAGRDAEYRLLMERYQAGDRLAFEALYDALAPVVGAWLSHLALDGTEVDERVEQVFLVMHQARRTYDPQVSFETWLAAIVDLVAVRARAGSRRRHR
jgi:DNA-directed RNA polymerase specialized sigma24 family protein